MARRYGAGAPNVAVMRDQSDCMANLLQSATPAGMARGREVRNRQNFRKTGGRIPPNLGVFY